MNTISFELEGHIGTILINTPPKNIMYIETIREIGQIINEIEEKQVKALIIRGAGRHFSSGADIDELRESIQNSTRLEEGQLLGYEQYKEVYEVFDRVHNLKIPVVCCIRGLCIGSGFELALSGHVRICSKDGLLGSPEATLGYLPALGGITRSADIVDRTKLFEIILGGQFYSAEEMQEIGLVDRMVNKKEIVEYCNAFANYLIEQNSTGDREQMMASLKEFELLQKN